MSKSYNFCNNCGKGGHSFHQCRQPITSIGVVAYRSRSAAGELEYLMIRRKDTLGFVDFMRGKYPLHDKRYLRNIIDEMTNDEKSRLRNQTFGELWSQLWGGNVGIQYRGEERVSRDKFNQLRNGVVCNDGRYTLEMLLGESPTSWAEPEWGFPKGRRNYQEKDLHCALREFEEETGYPKTTLQVIQNLAPFEEMFTGSNYKSYKHRYYVAQMAPPSPTRRAHQATEVSQVRWATKEEALQLIRPYNVEKQDLTRDIDRMLNSNRLYL